MSEIQEMKQKANKMKFGNFKLVTPYIINLDKRLGRGSFGEVFFAVDHRDNKVIAVKQINSQFLTNQQKQMKYLKNQIEIMKKLNHPNLVKLIDVLKSSNNYYIFMQNCDEGSLQSYLQKNGGQLSQKQSLQIFQQILLGYQKLYQLKIVHRDLKPDNILIKNKQFKIADFGLSKIIQNHEQILETSTGTPMYMSPQVILYQKYTISSDIWSLGIILYEMINGEHPFKPKNIGQLRKKAKQKYCKFEFKVKVSPETENLIRSMIKVEEKERIDFQTLFGFQFKTRLTISPQENLKQSMMGIPKLQESKKMISNTSRINNNYFSKENKVIKHVFGQKKVEVSKVSNNLNKVQQTSQLQYSDFEKFDNAFQNYDKQKKQKELQSKIEQWVLHRRNKAVFINYILLKLYELHQEQKFDLDNDIINISLFLISKYMLMILYKMYFRFKQKKLKENHKKFAKSEFDMFLQSSNLVKPLYSTLKNDFNVMQMFFKEIIEILKENPPPELKDIINNNMSEKSKFKVIFQKELSKLLKHLQQKQNIFKSQQLVEMVKLVTMLLNQKMHLGTDWDKIYEQISQQK